ncbi:MAG: hypothetical protein M9935_01765 [Kiritimatiellae bacterium]|nr:hypothetical protein [Kiritimatiellia bacterium]
MSGYELLRWLHIVCMIGLLGGFLVYQLGLSYPSRIDAADLRGVTRVWNILLLGGLITGLSMYAQVKGHTLGPHFNGVIAVKFSILIAVGGLLALAKRRSRGDGLRWLSIALLLVASLAAFTL